MKILTMVTKGCGQLASNDTYFSDSWFCGVKTSEEAMNEGVYYCGPEKTIHKFFCIYTLEKLMKEWQGGYYLVIKSNPRVSSDRPSMAIRYRYNYRKVLVFITNEGDGSTEPTDPYLSCYPENYSIVSDYPIFCPYLIGSYFNDFNTIENQNRMHKSELSLEKYGVTQCSYIRLDTTVALGMGITEGKLLFYHGISNGSKNKKI